MVLHGAGALLQPRCAEHRSADKHRAWEAAAVAWCDFMHHALKWSPVARGRWERVWVTTRLCGRAGQRAAMGGSGSKERDVSTEREIRHVTVRVNSDVGLARREWECARSKLTL